MTLECFPEGRNMSTTKDEEALYQNLKKSLANIYIYINIHEIHIYVYI